MRMITLRLLLLICLCPAYLFAASITNLEYFYDSDPGFGSGTAVAITPGVDITKAFTADVSSLANGFHILYVRAQDINNVWGQCQTHSFFKTGGDITKIEYFFDSDPGFGNGTNVPFTSGKDVTLNFSPDLTGISKGSHTLYVRAQDESGSWSLNYVKSFFKVGLKLNPEITYVEYFIDTDPGFGNGTSVTVTPSPDVTLDFTIDLNDVAYGSHKVYVRAKDANDNYSIIYVKDITVVDHNADTDNDGLPDYWEIEKFKDLTHTGTDDTDGDGYDNHSEFLGHSNPCDIHSIPYDLLVSSDGDCNGESNCYQTITGAYGDCADGGRIKVKSGFYPETLLFDQNKKLILACGWNSDYSVNDSTATAVGPLTLSAGTLEIENLVLAGSRDARRSYWDDNLLLYRELCSQSPDSEINTTFDYELGSNGGGYHPGQDNQSVLIMLDECERVEKLSLGEPYALEISIVEPAAGVYFMDANLSDTRTLATDVTCAGNVSVCGRILLESFAVSDRDESPCTEFTDRANSFSYSPLLPKQVFRERLTYRCNAETISDTEKIKAVRTCFAPFIETNKPILLIDLPTFYYDPGLVDSGTKVVVKVGIVRENQPRGSGERLCDYYVNIGIFE